MEIRDHMEGFEQADNFNKLFNDIRKYYPDFKYRQLHSAIAEVVPNYMEALGKRRLCFRKLRYIGCTWCHEEPPTDDEYFKLGQFYVGKSFNGATYTIDGYYEDASDENSNERPIGCAYFEWIEWNEDDLTWLPEDYVTWLEGIEAGFNDINLRKGVLGQI